MNKQQIIDVLKGVLVAGGPVTILLTMAFGMESAAAERIVTAIGSLVSIGGLIWLGMGRSDANMVKDAASVPGTQVHVDRLSAPQTVVNAAMNPQVKDVVPMIGPPRDDTNKTG